MACFDSKKTLRKVNASSKYNHVNRKKVKIDSFQHLVEFWVQLTSSFYKSIHGSDWKNLVIKLLHRQASCNGFCLMNLPVLCLQWQCMTIPLERLVYRIVLLDYVLLDTVSFFLKDKNQDLNLNLNWVCSFTATNLIL